MHYPNNIEEICYDQEHIDHVLDVIKKNMPDYFEKYLESESGKADYDEGVSQLMEKFGNSVKPKKKTGNPKDKLFRIYQEAIKHFENDREKYLEILDPDALQEYGLDVGSFKNTILKNQIPIIRKTLQNKQAKELDKFRQAFGISSSGELFNVVNKLVHIAFDWETNWYNSQEYEKIATYDELEYDELDEEGCYAHGVIGGGIKSHFLYKLYPKMFPYRSREALWALWYLSEQRKFGCKEDSEFLMINLEEITTQQNYFYPYALFAFYAFQIYYELNKYYKKYGLSIEEEYRFVAVESFLSYVAESHQNEIDLLKRSNKNYQYDY
jgi:hypothetical protein